MYTRLCAGGDQVWVIRDAEFRISFPRADTLEGAPGDVRLTRFRSRAKRRSRCLGRRAVLLPVQECHTYQARRSSGPRATCVGAFRSRIRVGSAGSSGLESWI